MHNVEKSKFQKGMYVGYGGGAVWHIRNYGKGNWKATPQGNNKHQVFSCATLRDVSTQLETLSAKPMDAAHRASNPAPRKYSGKYPRRIASTSSAVKDGVYVFVLNDGTSHRVATRDLIAAGYQKQAPQPGEDFDFILTAVDAARKTNPAKRPAPKKRAISRPSQITKKAPTKRLVARRKVAAKKPVKGYFPNPVAITAPGPSRKTHEDLPHLFPQPGGAYMVSFWRESTRKWVPATLAYSMNEAKKWLEYQGYKKAVLLK